MLPKTQSFQSTNLLSDCHGWKICEELQPKWTKKKFLHCLFVWWAFSYVTCTFLISTNIGQIVMGKRELKGQTDEKFNYDGRIYTLRGYKYYFIKFNISISNEKSERILIEFKLKPFFGQTSKLIINHGNKRLKSQFLTYTIFWLLSGNLNKFVLLLSNV